MLLVTVLTVINLAVQHQSRRTAKHGIVVLFQKMKAVLPRCLSRGTNWETSSKHRGGVQQHTTKIEAWLLEIVCFHQKLKNTFFWSTVDVVY